jgi:hypothetical protein
MRIWFAIIVEISFFETVGSVRIVNLRPKLRYSLSLTTSQQHAAMPDLAK